MSRQIIKTLTQNKLKTKLGKTPGDRRQQDVDIKDKTCVSYN
jgi:hypothetical protein